MGRRRAQSVLPMDVSLTALPPTAIFMLNDSYITGQPDGGNGTDDLYGYLTTSDGTLTGIPLPLPTLSISQVGPPLDVSKTIPAPSATPVSSPVNIGGFTVGAPTAPGHTAATIAADVNGQTLSATLNAYSYAAACVSAPNDGMSFTCAPGLYWDAAGVEHVTSDPTQADVYITDNGDGTNSLTFPEGAVELPSTLAYQVTTVPTVPAGPTAYTGVNINTEVNAGRYPFTYVFKTRSGLYVKWGIMVGFADPNTGLVSGSLWNMYGVYLAATGTAFAY
jgi:hypothetical protein